MKISFINEVANLCEKAGADVHDVARGIGLDGRIGRKFLHAGAGYGGSCFPKDTLAFARTGQDFGAPQRLVETTIAVNDERKEQMANRIIAACGGDVRGKTVAILGLAFKPETDDMRDAPSLSILPKLAAAGATLRAYDPEAMPHARQMLPAGLHYATNALDAAQGADCAVLLTEWNEFRALSPEKLPRRYEGPRPARPAQRVRAGRDARGGLHLPLHRTGLMTSFTHAFDPTTLREYDIRGIVGKTLSGADAFAIGRVFGSLVARAGGTKVAVGRDGRLSSPELEPRLVEGLMASGMEVLRVGCCPTPMLYYAAYALETDGAVMVTGSHNPPTTTASSP
jgi:UDPglucose 6-dehydrogenase